MSIKRIISWLLAVGSLALAASALAEHPTAPQSYDSKYALGNAPFSEAAPPAGIVGQIQPFGPVGFDMKADAFGPANISDYGNGPKAKIGFFFGYDRLGWTFSRPFTTRVGTDTPVTKIFNPATLMFDITIDQVVPENGQPVAEGNSTSTDLFGGTFGWGNRIEAGYMDTNDSGWLVGVLDHVSQSQTHHLTNAQIRFNDPNNLLSGFLSFLAPDGNVYDKDLNGNGVFGRDGFDNDLSGVPDVPAPTDLGDLVIFIPKFNVVELTNRTTLNGVELMRMFRAPQLHYGGQYEMLVGVRYLQVQDFFGIVGFGGILDAMSIETRVQNNIVGPQLGGRWYRQRGRWILSAEARVMLGANFENAHQSSLIASNSPNTNHPAPLIALPNNALNATSFPGPGTAEARDTPANLTPFNTQNNDISYAVAPVEDLRLQAAYQVTRTFALKLGYSAMFVDGISRANNRVIYSVPSPGLLPAHHENLFVQGLNIGFEFNR